MHLVPVLRHLQGRVHGREVLHRAASRRARPRVRAGIRRRAARAAVERQAEVERRPFSPHDAAAATVGHGCALRYGPGAADVVATRRPHRTTRECVRRRPAGRASLPALHPTSQRRNPAPTGATREASAPDSCETRLAGTAAMTRTGESCALTGSAAACPERRNAPWECSMARSHSSREVREGRDGLTP